MQSEYSCHTQGPISSILVIGDPHDIKQTKEEKVKKNRKTHNNQNCKT